MSGGADVALVEALRARGVLSPLDEHFARTVARLGGEMRAAVVLAAALVSRQVGNGHVCLDLPRLLDGAPLRDEAGDPVGADTWPPLEAWLATLRHSPLVGSADAPAGATPLVLDAAGRLYLRRYWQHQRQLAGAIAERAAEVDAQVDDALLRDGLRRLFPAPPGGEPDWQRVAACAAVQRRFCVISGGPGTGKTFTVVKILALLIEQALQRGGAPLRITLLAPTGKAAARLGEAIQQAKGGLAVAADVCAAIPEDPSTVHRRLGAELGRAGFRHHAAHPLATDVVLVDEASMVDLALMARLIDAMPAAARLILLGDQDQLASVEAGAVLGDICNVGGRRCYSTDFVARVATLAGDQLALDPSAPRTTGICDSIVSLTRSYRYRAESGIGRLARGINAGDEASVQHILDGGGDLRRCDPGAHGELGVELRELLDAFMASYAQAVQPRDRLLALQAFRVLCAHRRGPLGADAVNQQIERHLAAAGHIQGGETFYVGRPIMVTRNDYQLKLFNGDVGVIVDDAQRDGGRAAYFPTAEADGRRISPARLPPCDTVFAMTVHKSQGSEFDAVAVLLPDGDSPVVTRELLYTAVTRARRHVTLIATRETVARAVRQRVERASGLRDALWG
ncbi:MAG: exodeoxyribonuclease V subunit alpha [Candidatus Binatia bacterium]